MKVQLKKQFYYKQIIKSIFFIALNFIILSSIACQDRLIVLWDEPFLLVCDTSLCPGPQNVYLGDSTALTLNNPRVDPNDTQILWTVLSGPGGETWNPPGQNAIFQNFTPDAIGTYDMQVNYEVYGGTCAYDFTVTVDPPPCDTSICPGNVSVAVGEEASLDIAGVNPDATNISWTILSGPGNGTWNTPRHNSITEGFTPDSPGTYNMQVSYDLYGQTCSCEFKIYVESVPCDENICPASTNMYAGDNITLDIQGVDPGVTNINWQLFNPYSGEIWSPSGQNAISELFTPYIIGVYNMQVNYNVYGQTCICDFNLDVQLKPSQFRIELTWDGKGDIDLHLNHPSMTDPMTEKWETSKDCFYANRKTNWGASLDVDNIKKNGPENIMLDSSIGPTGKYHIGIKNFIAADGRVATVKLYCGSNKPTVYKSRPLQSNDFWILGSINPDTCNIKNINKYRL